MKQLRILFTIIAAIIVAAVLPVGVIFGWTWAGCCVVGAFLFYFLMLFCKQKQEENEPPNQDADTTDEP